MKARLAAYLWCRDGEPPAEYLMLVLCRDVFPGRFPSEVRKLPLTDVLPLLTCVGIEAKR